VSSRWRVGAGAELGTAGHVTGADPGGVGGAVVEVVGARVRVACEGGGGWGQHDKTEPLGLGFGERIAGGLVF
jgi:hypothetical protein